MNQPVIRDLLHVLQIEGPRGMTATTLARRIGLSAGHVSRLLRQHPDMFEHTGEHDWRAPYWRLTQKQEVLS